jgi:hypothetical protein
VHAGAVTLGQAAFARDVVAAAGTPKRIGTASVSAVPLEDHFAKRETLGISPRMAAVKFAVSGSLIKEISPASRLCGTGAFSRSGSSVIVRLLAAHKTEVMAALTEGDATTTSKS